MFLPALGQGQCPRGTYWHVVVHHTSLPAGQLQIWVQPKIIPTPKGQPASPGFPWLPASVGFPLGAALFGDIDLANRRGEGGHADGPSMAGWWSVGRPDRGRGDCGRARHFRGRSSNPRSQHWSAGSEV